MLIRLATLVIFVIVVSPMHATSSDTEDEEHYVSNSKLLADAQTTFNVVPAKIYRYQSGMAAIAQGPSSKPIVMKGISNKMARYCVEAVAPKDIDEESRTSIASAFPYTGISYVYVLLDSRKLPKTYRDECSSYHEFSNAIFYVGKGTNDRPYDHISEAMSIWRDRSKIVHGRTNPKKVHKLISILRWNEAVVTVQLDGTMGEYESLCREHLVMEHFGYTQLTNMRPKGRPECLNGINDPVLKKKILDHTLNLLYEAFTKGVNVRSYQYGAIDLKQNGINTIFGKRNLLPMNGQTFLFERTFSMVSYDTDALDDEEMDKMTAALLPPTFEGYCELLDENEPVEPTTAPIVLLPAQLLPVSGRPVLRAIRTGDIHSVYNPWREEVMANPTIQQDWMMHPPGMKSSSAAIHALFCFDSFLDLVVPSLCGEPLQQILHDATIDFDMKGSISHHIIHNIRDHFFYGRKGHIEVTEFIETFINNVLPTSNSLQKAFWHNITWTIACNNDIIPYHSEGIILHIAFIDERPRTLEQHVVDTAVKRSGLIVIPPDTCKIKKIIKQEVPQYLIIHFEPTLTEAGEKVNRHRIIWKDTTFQKGEYKEPGKIVLGQRYFTQGSAKFNDHKYLINKHIVDHPVRHYRVIGEHTYGIKKNDLNQDVGTQFAMFEAPFPTLPHINIDSDDDA